MEFSVADAKARFSELLARAEAGEEIVIRRHGKAVARLAPVRQDSAVEHRLRAWDEWIAYRDAHGIALGPDFTLRQLIDDGRR